MQQSIELDKVQAGSVLSCSADSADTYKVSKQSRHVDVDMAGAQRFHSYLAYPRAVPQLRRN